VERREPYNEDDKVRSGERLVNRLHLRVVESLADSLGAHNNSTEVAQSLDLLDGLEDLLRRNAGDERKRTESEETLLSEGGEGGRGGVLRGSVGRAVLLDVDVKIVGGGDGLVRFKEVEPGVCKGDDLQKTGSVLLHMRMRRC
jgi:hypothetical protein